MFKTAKKIKCTLLNKKLILLFLFLIFINVSANEVKIYKRYNNTSTPQLTQTIIGQDLLIEGLASYYTGDYVNVNQKTLIKFGLDGLPQNDYLNGFTAKIVLDIVPILTNGTFGQNYSRTLNIEFNPNIGIGSYSYLKVVEILNSRGAKISITEFNFKHNGVEHMGNPGNVYLDLEHNTDQYQELDNTLPTTNVTINLNEEIEFSWTNVDGAEEYELEWTWIDNFGDTLNANENSNLSLRDFELNNSRVRLKSDQNTYTIPNVFSKGNILFRVRAIGRFMENVSINYYGEWSTDASLYTTINNWPLNTARITVFTHQSNKNWQYQTSFAENGKKKEVVSYFDGTLRNRQTVTKINTKNQIVVGEVIYDTQGRPAIEILPTPIYDPTDKNKITFYPNLNKNENNVIYSHNDFDWDEDPDVCGTIAGFMDTNSGSSKYYSNIGNNDPNQENWQKYVPEAEKYPFSQIEYTPDNTGRISRKSGVGVTHQLNSDHEMKYFYLTPYQEKLNRLFGYNVGNAEHYKKNIVVDPNKQVSVSYIDPQGRTIATSLVGNRPSLDTSTESRLLALDEETNGNHLRYTYDLLNNNVIYNEGNIDGKRVVKHIGVESDGIYKFDYTLNINPDSFVPYKPNVANPGLCDLSYLFNYDLNISLLDNCADEKLVAAPNGNVEISLNPNYTEEVDLNVGTYSLVKDLQINKNRLEIYANQYIAELRNENSPCYLDPNAFAPQADFNSCAITCDGCAIDLVSLYYTFAIEPTIDDITTQIIEVAKQNYVDIHTTGFESDASGNETSVPITNTDGDVFPIENWNDFDEGIKSQYKTRFETEFDLLYEACMAPCNEESFSATCTIFNNMLQSDMSPGGQYGDDTLTLFDGIYVVENKESIFYHKINNLLIFDDTLTPVQKSWRDIQYKDEFGQDFKVYLLVEEQDDDTFTYYPEILDVLHLDADEDGVFVKPQHLKSVKDFFTIWQPYWAEDLVRFHPEYIYQEYQENLCTNEIPIDFNGQTESLSALSYDSFLLNVETYQDAYDLGLFNHIEDIYVKDPYFQIHYLGEIATFNYRNSIMDEATKTIFEGQVINTNQDVNMFESTFLSTFPSITNVDFIAGQQISSDADFTGLSNTQKTLLWNAYKNYYIAFKQKIFNVFLHLHAKENKQYNGCIGIDNPDQPYSTYQNDNLAEIFSNYTIFNDLNDYDNIQPVGFCHTVDSDSVYDFYKVKSKRYFNIDNSYDSGVSDQQAIEELENLSEYELWLQTGRCPLSYDLEFFLNSFFNEINENETSSLNLNSLSRLHTSQSITPDLLESYTGVSLGALVSYDEQTSISGQTLNLSLGNFNTTEPIILSCDNLVELNINGYNWSNYNPEVDTTNGSNGQWKITDLSNLYYDTYQDVGGQFIFSFQIIASVFDFTQGTIIQTILTGTTCSPIGECGTSTDGSIIGEVLDGSNSTNPEGSLSVTTEQKKQMFHNLIKHLYKRIINNQPISNGYNPQELQVLAPFILIDNPSINNFRFIHHFGLNYFYDDWSIQKVPYLIQFSFSENYTGSGINQIINGSFTNILVNIDEDYTYAGCEPNYIDCYFPFSNWNFPSIDYSNFDYLNQNITTSNSDTLNSFPKSININLMDFSPYEGGCTTQQIQPIACTSKYDDFISFLGLNPDYTSNTIENFVLPIELRHGVGTLNDILDANGNTLLDEYGVPLVDAFGEFLPNPNGIDDALDYFCGLNLGYFVEPYMLYLHDLGITTTYDPLYLSIEVFSATNLNQNTELLNDAVEFYINYNPTVALDNPERLFWNNFANQYLAEHSEICPPPSLDPIWNFQVPINQIVDNCVQFALEISSTYSSEAYENYLAYLKERFKREYIEQGLNNVEETFTEEHFDKEYQYTLYYYDQAGNLIQTVPPEGIDRKDDIDNNLVDTYRENPSGTAPVVPDHRLKTLYKYNSLNQLVWQKTPDGGETRFAYDALGRIIASQNAKQIELITIVGESLDQKAFSYTKYDALGRITEAGQTYLANYYGISEKGKIENQNTSPGVELSFEDALNDANSSGIRTEISITKYDKIKLNYIPYFESYASNSRGRVTTVKYYNELSSLDVIEHNNAIYYDYDIHGNVKEIVREINDDDYLKQNDQHLKNTKYQYDLISGNVNTVTYQKGKTDQFIHKYQYDADNRITNVQTSRDGIIWEKDASYNYYDHGPLARTVIGEHQVQGLDYAYTLQGWLKSVNSDRLSPDIDMGKDSFGSSSVAKDAFAYALHYYDGDYNARSGNNNFINFGNTHPYNLYNGNIKSMVTSLIDQKGDHLNTSYNNYRYDQLNRIKEMNSEEIFVNGIYTDGINTNYSFDRNGNLLTLQREARHKDGSIYLMDDFEYRYNKDSDNILNNQLQLVHDKISTENLFSVDLDDQIAQLTSLGINYNSNSAIDPITGEFTNARDTHNYQYDQIGQLIKDKTEGIDNIEWTVSGKVKKITKIGTDAKEIEFTYDPLGNRLSKKVTNLASFGTPVKTTYYIRDAQGNVLSIYKKEETSSTTKPQIILEEQNIYGSSRVGLQKLGIDLLSTKNTKSTTEVNRAMHFDSNIEANISDDLEFNFVNKEAINIGVLLEISTPDNDGEYTIAKFEDQNLDSITKLHQLKIGVKYEDNKYYPQLKLRTFKDSTYIKNVVFTLDDGFKEELLNINYDVQILNEVNNKYDVVFNIDSKSYIVDQGVTQHVYYEPYATSHTSAINKIAPNSDNPLNFELDEFNYAINGTSRSYGFDKGFGNPVSKDGLKTLQVEPTKDWVFRGVILKDHERVIGDKRYELSNHLGNVLSVISDHKAISTDTGIVTHLKSFKSGTDILPWQAQPLTEYVGIEKDRLRVSSKTNLNGVEAYYTLEEGKVYEFQFNLDRDLTKAIIEFGIKYNGKKYLTEYLNKSGKQIIQFKVNVTGDYLLDITIRDNEKTFVKAQTFYIDNFVITDNTNKNLDLTTDNITFVPDVLSYNDYYPYGMIVPNRNYQSPEYRYGFNGKEKDDEVKGSGTQYDYGFRIYDPRIGKFLSQDPLFKSFPWYTPYQFAGNKPINSIDLDGLEEVDFREIKANEDGSTLFEVVVDKEVNYSSNQGKILKHNLDTDIKDTSFDYKELNDVFDNVSVSQRVGINGSLNSKGYYSLSISQKKYKEFKDSGIILGIGSTDYKVNDGINFTSITIMAKQKINKPKEISHDLSNLRTFTIGSFGGIERTTRTTTSSANVNISYGRWDLTTDTGNTNILNTRANNQLLDNIADVLNSPVRGRNQSLSTIQIVFPSPNARGFTDAQNDQVTRFNQAKFASFSNNLRNRGVNPDRITWFAGPVDTGLRNNSTIIIRRTITD